MAGVPRRMPEVRKGLRESKGTMFLLAVMSASTRGFFGYLACEFGEFAAEVYEDAVVVGAAGDDVIAHFDECASEVAAFFCTRS